MKRINRLPLLIAAAVTSLAAGSVPARAAKEVPRAPLFETIAITPITVTCPAPFESLDPKAQKLLQELSDVATKQAQSTIKGRGVTASSDRIAPEKAVGRIMLSGTLRLPVIPPSDPYKLYNALRRDGAMEVVTLRKPDGTVIAQASITIHSVDARWMSGSRVTFHVHGGDVYAEIVKKTTNGAVKKLAEFLANPPKVPAANPQSS